MENKSYWTIQVDTKPFKNQDECFSFCDKVMEKIGNELEKNVILTIIKETEKEFGIENSGTELMRKDLPLNKKG